jgi:hypothetical protein
VSVYTKLFSYLNIKYVQHDLKKSYLFVFDPRAVHPTTRMKLKSLLEHLAMAVFVFPEIKIQEKNVIVVVVQPGTARGFLPTTTFLLPTNQKNRGKESRIP